MFWPKERLRFFNLIFSIFGGIFFGYHLFGFGFLSYFGRKWSRKIFRSILPKIYENRLIPIFERSTSRIGRWFQGRLLLSLVIGLFSWLGFYLFGVEYSGTLALLAAVLDIVPIVGPIFAGLIIFLAALTDSWLLGVWVVVFLLSFSS